MKRLVFLSLLACLFMFGCATPASRISNITIGMTRDDVSKILGQPINTTNDGASEIMNYRLAEDMETTYPYVVVLQGGKVVSYGRMGGGDSSSRPTQFQPIFIPTK